ncbi:Glutaminyl-peptide cyclotransferase-like protein [Hapsidospora chrysogenum ATCC 11550]|uniref:Peptide hydrolase n=1 Tax=Hapsidospora chrysogenum (strain ATCC 11550 / CBS 779.69 / DSM 880 / IAM 14645 / JCM 23072 / IMI 49137) TaxID=857340 RepID=A0A086ST63_HAPC1|nr:Glutaminyl-peptide cyclotransferase-like protein [Hapsidospora chrysogenum ATCC 11550]
MKTTMPLPATWFLLMAYLLSYVESAASSFATLTDDHLRNIPSPGDDFDIHDGKLLAPILIPRVPGTEGSLKVQQHFVDFFAHELPDWDAISQNSTSKTPATGDRDVPFVNWIFRRDPPWAREGDVGRLTLVAHFDSLMKPEGFIGAIDSAAPCAMLMHVARSIDKALSAKWKAMEDSGDDGLEEAKGIQIIFMDGEEAFERWTDTDSLYGARSLAEEWDTHAYGSMSTYKTPLQSISLFVLLDLLGAADPTVPSYFLPTHWAYRNMASLEKRMRDLDILESKPKEAFMPDSAKTADRFGRGYIGDDHVPFMQRGVEILHLIPSPFPVDLWHKMEDDGEHLDLPTCRDWSKIVTAFTMEWLELGQYMPEVKGAVRQDVKGSGTGIHKNKRTEL